MAGAHRTSSVWERQKHTSSSVFLVITAVDREAQRLHQLLLLQSLLQFFRLWTSLKHQSLKCMMMTVILCIITIRLPMFPWVQTVVVWMYYKVESWDTQSFHYSLQIIRSRVCVRVTVTITFFFFTFSTLLSPNVLCRNICKLVWHRMYEMRGCYMKCSGL